MSPISAMNIAANVGRCRRHQAADGNPGGSSVVARARPRPRRPRRQAPSTPAVAQPAGSRRCRAGPARRAARPPDHRRGPARRVGCCARPAARGLWPSSTWIASPAAGGAEPARAVAATAAARCRPLATKMSGFSLPAPTLCVTASSVMLNSSVPNLASATASSWPSSTGPDLRGSAPIARQGT